VRIKLVPCIHSTFLALLLLWTVEPLSWTHLANIPEGAGAFTGCGKTPLWGLVTGHDFSRADKANKINGL
jgi:hypothetical protein